MAIKPSPSMAPRPLLARLAVAVVAVMLTVLAAEGAARVAFPQWAPRTARLTDFWRYDPRYGWSHIPGAHGVFRSDGIDADVSINARGYRGPEVAYERSPRHPRVVFLGDSYTWGFGVNFDDVFTARLERLVPGLQAVNLSVSGYSTDQELLVYQNEGRKYRADLVVVTVAYNDNDGNARTVEYMVYGKPAFVLRGDRLQLVNQPVVQPSIVTRTFTRLAWRSYVLTQIHRALYDIGIGQSRAHAAAPARSVDVGAGTLPPVARNWAFTARLLLEMAREVRADGAQLLVVFADGIPAAPALSRVLAADGVPSVVLDEVLDVHDPALHLPDEVHWSPRGHALVAATLAGPIREALGWR